MKRFFCFVCLLLITLFLICFPEDAFLCASLGVRLYAASHLAPFSDPFRYSDPLSRYRVFAAVSRARLETAVFSVLFRNLCSFHRTVVWISHGCQNNCRFVQRTEAFKRRSHVSSDFFQFSQSVFSGFLPVYPYLPEPESDFSCISDCLSVRFSMQSFFPYTLSFF